ncbi:cucumber peeling cupredoxin-like protein [Tanacetum coccineum]
MTVAMVACMQFKSMLAGNVYKVGDVVGWTLLSNTAFYTLWAAQIKFKVTDVLWFNFTSGNHTFAEVSKEAYGPCIRENPIRDVPTGPNRITLMTLGPHYFICTKQDHCKLRGQKFTTDVSP